ncbi:MAG: CopL family metal-binding regulatory protein [Proteobacteria bacterium]|nr:CopL family metal-binding regulatory protein [Pseudomonadota bacterium]
MSLWSLLLRVTLSLSLIASGMASAAMPVHGAGYMHAAQATQHVAMEQPCHAHAGMSAMTQHGHGDSAPDKHQQHPQPDCCKSGLCQCACVHAMQMSMASLMATPNVHVMRVARLQPSHAGPVLPHLIRPPIG